MEMGFAKRYSRLIRFVLYCFAGAVVGVTWSQYLRAHNQGTTSHTWREFALKQTHAGFPPGILISLVLLCLFSLYWEAAAKNSSEAKSREPSWSRAIHVTLVSVGQFLMLLPVPGLRQRFIPDHGAIVAVGVLLEFSFLAFAIWARQLLGRNWSGAVTTKVDHELIRSGPYQFVRHPIYSGMLGAYASLALVSGEVH